MVPETFERTQQQVTHILSAHRQLRSLRESEPDVLRDLLRAGVVLVERSFVSAAIDLAALAVPANLNPAFGRPGRSASVRPSKRDSANRRGHLPTVIVVTPSSAATRS